MLVFCKVHLNLNAQNIGGTVQHADAFVTTGSITVQYGTYASNYNLTCLNFSSAYTNTRAITFGGNVISLTGTGLVWNTATTTGLDISALNYCNIYSVFQSLRRR